MQIKNFLFNMETKSFKTNSREGELNLFLRIIFIGGIIRTIVNCISVIIKYSIYNDEYFGVFFIAIIIFSATHIFGIIYTLIKKSLWGIWIIFGNIICSICIIFLLNEIFQYKIFDTDKMILNAAQLILIPLVLLLRKNGKSAWSILIKNSNFKKTEKKEITTSNMLLFMKKRRSVLKYIDYKFMLIVWAFISIITIGCFHLRHHYILYYPNIINNNWEDVFILEEEEIEYKKVYIRNTGLEISIVISLSGFLLIGGWGYINNKKKREIIPNDKPTM
ncbi:MAG: hypothetical protein Q7I99_03795 [Acholeplasmataceae bacterium]|nr:hypothetical protein [Acholeplasmataceae bacterium]